MLRLAGLSSQTTYGATIYLGTSQQGYRILLAETIAGQYEALPTGLAAGIYTVVFDNDGTEVARIVYEWNGAAEVTNSVIYEKFSETSVSSQTVYTHRNSSSSIQIKC